MDAFILDLYSATQYERIEGVVCFIAEDASGSFGILANHARMLACLNFGLARFRTADGSWEYLALPGGVARFQDNQLRLSTRRYLRHRDRQRVRAELQQQIQAEEDDLREVKNGLARLEQDMLRQLWKTVHPGGSAL